MRTYSSFCGTVCSDSTGTVTSDAAVRLHRRYQIYSLQDGFTLFLQIFLIVKPDTIDIFHFPNFVLKKLGLKIT